MSRIARSIAALAGALFALTAHAASPYTASYPQRPIRLIVPSAAGGPIDTVGRAVNQGMSQFLGQQVVIDNRAGAGGMIGAEIVAKSAPDGYTLLLGTPGLLMVVPHITTGASYTLGDFAPVSVLAKMPMLLLAHPALPAKTVPELIALAKSRPGKLNYASGGVGTGIHIGFEMFNRAAGIQVTHVPYKGAAPGMTAVVGGEADLMFNAMPVALPLVKQERLRALGIGSRKRSGFMPTVSTIAEAGLDYEYEAWYSIVVPRGTPPAIVGRLYEAVTHTLGTPDLKDRLAGYGIEAVGSSPKDFAAYMREEDARMDKVITATGLRVKK